jgi:uncharacterized repeat protein (TIGR03803 family)
MSIQRDSSASISNFNLRSKTIAILVATVGWAILAVSAMQGQTFDVIHTFTGGNDGSIPLAGLTIDRAGNLYGTASGGGVTGPCGSYGCGIAFRLKSSASGWTMTPLHAFQKGTDGANPEARLLLSADGALYGTTLYGGGHTCYFLTCGIVFKLTPSPTVCKTPLCAWNETVLYRFVGQPYAGNPGAGPLTLDHAGNLYGTAAGGVDEHGVIYELISSGGTWSENDIGREDNGASGVVFDSAGNLYGTNTGEGYGGIYQLSPSGTGWTQHQLYSILNVPQDGFDTNGGVILDGSGNIYGGTLEEGPGNGGTVYELSAGSWNYSVLYAFTGGSGPDESLTMDAAGNIYGTTWGDGTNFFGNVFKLAPSANGWVYTDLYDFTGGSDGANPVSNVVIDTQGNLYGTASNGGDNSRCVRTYNRGCGTVWKITP